MATANDIIKIAKAEIGVTEYPSGSNNVKYNTAYYGGPVSGPEYPWCCAFVWWVFQQAGAGKLFYGGYRTASCTTLMAFHKNRGEFVTSDYRPGDLAMFDFDDNKRDSEHIGIIIEVYGDEIITIEGNTSVTSDDNGGAVMRRTRNVRQLCGAIRPKYDAEENDMKCADFYAMFEKAMADYNAKAAEAELSPDHWAIKSGELEEAKELGITDGTRPLATINRIEAAAMALRAYKKAKEELSNDGK